MCSVIHLCCLITRHLQSILYAHTLAYVPLSDFSFLGWSYLCSKSYLGHTAFFFSLFWVFEYEFYRQSSIFFWILECAPCSALYFYPFCCLYSASMHLSLNWFLKHEYLSFYSGLILCVCCVCVYIHAGISTSASWCLLNAFLCVFVFLTPKSVNTFWKFLLYFVFYNVGRCSKGESGTGGHVRVNSKWVGLVFSIPKAIPT